MKQFTFLLITAFALSAQAQSVQIHDRALPDVKRLISSRLTDLTCTVTAGSTDQHRNSDLLNFMRNFKSRMDSH